MTELHGCALSTDQLSSAILITPAAVWWLSRAGLVLPHSTHKVLLVLAVEPHVVDTSIMWTLVNALMIDSAYSTYINFPLK